MTPIDLDDLTPEDKADLLARLQADQLLTKYQEAARE